MFYALTHYRWQKKDLLFVAVALLALLPVISSPVALILGMALAALGLVPRDLDLGLITRTLLAGSIVGLGFGINLEQAIVASQQGIGLIVTSIFSTLVIGWGLTRLLGIEHKTGHMIAAGTAICGGSAIAAVAPAIDAKGPQVSLALATVFILNSAALFVFPAVGHLLHMSQHAFGVWSAIAIHDTSSVVGAASAYGDEALVTATTLKLARALWIIPVAFVSSLLFKGQGKRISIPFFILFYALAVLLAHVLPQYSALYHEVFVFSKRVLVLCLFLIGCGITWSTVRAAGARPLLLGLLLWLLIGSGSLAYIQLVM